MEFFDSVGYAGDGYEVAESPESVFSFGDFFGDAINRVTGVVAPTQDDGSNPIMSQLSEAIYQFGRGKIDAAREKAVGAFLMTSEGKKTQAEGIKQTVTQYLPMIVIALLAVFMLGAMAKR